MFVRAAGHLYVLTAFQSMPACADGGSLPRGTLYTTLLFGCTDWAITKDLVVSCT